MADQGSYNAIASGVNRGANPASQQSSNPTATQQGLSTVGTLGTMAGMNPAVGVGLSALGALNTYGVARQQDLGFLDSVQSAVAGTLPGSVLGIQSPLEQSLAVNKGNVAAPTPYSSGIAAHSPSVPNSAIATGRKDYQGAPIGYDSQKGTPQQQQDVLDAVTAAAQQSLASKGNLAAPVAYSSGITSTGNKGIDALNAAASQQSSTPSIAGSISQANQATAPTATGGPRGMSASTASVGSPPGMSNKGLSLGDIPGISRDIANRTMGLSPIASQVSQAVSGTTPSQAGGMSSEAMAELAGMAAAEAQEADEASSPGGSVGAGGSTPGHSGDQGAKFNLGGMVGYQTNDSLKDLMRGYF